MTFPAYLMDVGAAMNLPPDQITAGGGQTVVSPSGSGQQVPMPPPAATAAPLTPGGTPDPLAGRLGPAPNPIEQGVALAQARGDLPTTRDPVAFQRGDAPGDAPGRRPAPFGLQRLPGSGGMVPAREMDMRGPSLRNAQADLNAAFGMAAEQNAANTQATAQDEAAMYAEQERRARLREEIAMQSAAARDEELAQRQADFDASSRQLSKMSLDPNRFWASRSTGEKIGAMVAIGLGGFVQGARGGSNAGLDIINTAIERDIKAQEFSYFAARDAAQSKQTAFAMAMQKYQNVDAARAMARAAALDGVAAQVGQMGATWKDTQAANHANNMIVALEEMRMNQIAQGVKFLPPTMAARQYVYTDPETGASVVMSEGEVKGLLKERRDQSFEKDKIAMNVEGKLAEEDLKAQLGGAKDLRESLVKLPSGEVVRAPGTAEATKLRNLSHEAQKAYALVDEAKQIRSDPSWLYTPSKVQRLKAIESRLLVSFKEDAALGALSEGDKKLAQGTISDLTSILPREGQLDEFKKHVNMGIRNRVGTYPDASATAQGKLTDEAAADFKPYGAKK